MLGLGQSPRVGSSCLRSGRPTAFVCASPVTLPMTHHQKGPRTQSIMYAHSQDTLISLSSSRCLALGLVAGRDTHIRTHAHAHTLMFAHTRNCCCAHSLSRAHAHSCTCMCAGTYTYTQTFTNRSIATNYVLNVASPKHRCRDSQRQIHTYV